MPTDDLKQRVATLTPRHREVLRLISLGCSVNEIAAILKLSPSTVDNHRTALMQRLAVEKSTLLTRIAIKSRLSKIDDQLTLGEKRRRGRKRDGWN
ncbi:MAG: response regulator transcription factor [Planctomycetales bacterium]|nr:response regulator transcription factor [Planctomycetales bacterium]